MLKQALLESLFHNNIIQKVIFKGRPLCNFLHYKVQKRTAGISCSNSPLFIYDIYMNRQTSSIEKLSRSLAFSLVSANQNKYLVGTHNRSLKQKNKPAGTSALQKALRICFQNMNQRIRTATVGTL